MKRVLAVFLIIVMIFSFAACGGEKQPEEDDTPKFDPSKKTDGVMTYEQYIAAGEGESVVIEAFVQACQSWWDNKISVYAQDPDGGYFIYNMVCSEADAEKLVPGTPIRVSGVKTEWAGETKIADGATFEIVEGGTWIADAEDVTSLLGTDELVKYQNRFVSFKGLTVKTAAVYKWDNSGMRGDDLYFDVSLNGKTYSFMVESYLCGRKTEVYKAVEALKPGDKVDMEGFLWWCEDINPQITKVTVLE